MSEYLLNEHIQPTQKHMFSIIILSYNNIDLIDGLLSSIEKQTYDNIEIIIGDDSSHEFYEQEVFNKIRRIITDKRVTLHIYQNTCNSGTVKNLNKAISISNGAYIKCIGADDSLYESSTLSFVADYFLSHNELLLTSKVLKCDSNMVERGKVFKNGFQKKIPSYKSDDYKLLCLKNLIVATGVFFRREFFKKYGKFNETYFLLEDWPTWLRITRNGEAFGYLDKITVKYRTNAGVATSINNCFIEDRRKCYLNEVKPFIRYYGFFKWCVAGVLNCIYTSKRIRTCYALLFRR